MIQCKTVLDQYRGTKKTIAVSKRCVRIWLPVSVNRARRFRLIIFLGRFRGQGRSIIDIRHRREGKVQHQVSRGQPDRVKTAKVGDGYCLQKVV